MPRYVKYFLFLLIFGGFSLLYLRSLLLVPKVEHTIKVLNQVTFPTKKEGFRYQWLRQRNDRLNWRAILLPCQGRTEWSKTSPGWSTANRTSANTSYISYLDIRPAGQFSRFFIQTRMLVVVLKELVETRGTSSSVGVRPLVRLSLITPTAHMKYCSFSWNLVTTVWKSDLTPLNVTG